jgi:hypothetical protein
MLIRAMGNFAVVVGLGVMEINVEGRYGWAEKLPTWYRVTGWAGRFWGKIMNGKPLTGYHLALNGLLLIFFNWTFFQEERWPTLVEELSVLSQFFAMSVYWDFMWFLLNPYYLSETGVGFSKQSVWWHALSHWVADLFPLDYLMGILISIGLSIASSLYTSWTQGWAWETQAVKDQLTLIGYLGLATFITVFLAPLYHLYYWYMRRKDDRKLVDIFHDDSPASQTAPQAL